MMIVLLLFLQKQNLANAIYLFGLGTLLYDCAKKTSRINIKPMYTVDEHGETNEPIGVRRNKNKTYVECRYVAPTQKARQ
jgi:hypothetical protein